MPGLDDIGSVPMDIAGSAGLELGILNVAFGAMTMCKGCDNRLAQALGVSDEMNRPPR